LCINLENYGIATRGIHIIWGGILNRHNRFVDICLQKFSSEGGNDYGTGQTGCSTIFYENRPKLPIFEEFKHLGGSFCPLAICIRASTNSGDGKTNI
jgi:hypothetical protein